MLCFSAVALTAFTENLAICCSFQILFHFFGSFTVQCLTTVLIDTLACIYIYIYIYIYIFVKVRRGENYIRAYCLSVLLANTA